MRVGEELMTLQREEKTGKHYQCPLCGVGTLFDPFGSDWRPIADDAAEVKHLGADKFQVTIGTKTIECTRLAAKRLAAALKTMLSEKGPGVCVVAKAAESAK